MKILLLKSNTQKHLTLANETISVKKQYSKTFKCGQMKLLVLKSNTRRHLSVGK